MFKKELFIGMIIGAVGGWFATKRYYENEFEVIEQDVEDCDTEEVHIKMAKGNDKSMQSHDEIKDKLIDRKGPRVNVVDNVRELVPTNKKEEIERFDMHTITEAEYEEEGQGFEKVELQYNLNGDKLVDIDGNDHADIFDRCENPEPLFDFADDESQQFIYFRDEKLKIDYLIEKEDFVDMSTYDNLAVAYKEEHDAILEEKNRGVKNES